MTNNCSPKHTNGRAGMTSCSSQSMGSKRSLGVAAGSGRGVPAVGPRVEEGQVDGTAPEDTRYGRRRDRRCFVLFAHDSYKPGIWAKSALNGDQRNSLKMKE